MLLGTRVVATSQVSLRVKAGTVGTVLSSNGRYVLIQVDTIGGNAVIESVDIAKLRQATYSDVVNATSRQLVDPKYQEGAKLVVKDPGPLEALTAGTEVSIKEVKLTTQADADAFKIEDCCNAWDVSLNFLQFNCTPVVEKPVIQQGTRMRVITGTTRLQVNSIVTVMRQDEDQLTVGFIDSNGEEQHVGNNSVNLFAEVTKQDIANVNPETVLDPLFRVNATFEAKSEVSQVLTLRNNFKPGDEVQIVAVKSLAVNAFDDVFTVHNKNANIQADVACLELATFFNSKGIQHKAGVEHMEKQVKGKIELPLEGSKVHNDEFEKEIVEQLGDQFTKLVSSTEMFENDPEKVKQLLKVAGITENEAGEWEVDHEYEEPIIITGLSVGKFDFKFENGMLIQLDTIRFADIYDYGRALERVGILFKEIYGDEK